MLILTKYVTTHEFKPLDRYLKLDDIIDGARKVLKGLGIETKAPSKISGFRFFKIRIGKRNGARMLVFMVTESQKIVPILIRLKKDKIFGMNMAMNNPQVVIQMNKNLDYVLKDIESKNYQEFQL
ncbi:MAG: hypothetical protein AAB373_00825 [Patescibacteria group bacterium]